MLFLSTELYTRTRGAGKLVGLMGGKMQCNIFFKVSTWRRVTTYTCSSVFMCGYLFYIGVYYSPQTDFTFSREVIACTECHRCKKDFGIIQNLKKVLQL